MLVKLFLDLHDDYTKVRVIAILNCTYVLSTFLIAKGLKWRYRGFEYKEVYSLFITHLLSSYTSMNLKYPYRFNIINTYEHNI